jgi:hypothetical protein
MDQITHQPPRQQGYGSTSSLRNDSLKHTWKHERRRKESNQITKHSGTGGLSGQEGRTVRTGHADRPACCHGLSAPAPRTVRLWAADCPKKQTEPPETTPNNGPSAGSTQTVCQAPADCPPAAADCPKPLPTKARNQNGSKAKPSNNTKNPRRTLRARTVRQALADRPLGTNRTENCSTPKVNTPNPSPDLPNGRSCWDKSLGTWKVSTKDAIPQNFRLLTS